VLPEFLKTPFCRSRAGILAGVLALALPAALPAQDANAPKAPPSLDEKTSEAFGNLKPLIDAHNWTAAMNLLNSIQATVAPTSYDMAIVLNTKAKIFMQEDQMANAIGPWETVLKLNSGYGYLEPKEIRDIVHYLAEIYSQVGSAIKVGSGPDQAQQEALQKEDYDKSLSYMKQWLDETPNPSQDDELFYGTLLFNMGVGDPARINQALVTQAGEAAEKGIRLAIHPKDQLYQLLIASLQQRGDMVQSADYLELLVAQKPDSKIYWPQLMAAYLNLAGNYEGDPAKSRQYNIRAISAIERAQAHGFMKEPRYNLNLVTIYYTVNQFGKAAELLRTGLKSGAIESTLKNWQVLAYCYQQLNNNDEAIAVYKQAEPLFPTSGQLDYYIAQIYSNLDNIPQAYEYYKVAVAKGNVSSPFQVDMFLAYAAFELQKFDEALKACDAAAALPEGKNDKTLQRLRSGIEETMKQQAAEKAAAATN